MLTEMKELTQENTATGFLTNHADTGLKHDLLLFWQKYPYARFTSGIIARAVDRNRRVDVEEALECFVKAELIEKHVRQGLPFYRLTAEPTKRQDVLDLPVRRGSLRPMWATG